jgi:hypothetical protein
MTTLRSKVAKQRNQTNSNLLGMDLARQRARTYFFFWVGPPGLLMNRGPSFKLDRSQALGYNGI